MSAMLVRNYQREIPEDIYQGVLISLRDVANGTTDAEIDERIVKWGRAPGMKDVWAEYRDGINQQIKRDPEFRALFNTYAGLAKTVSAVRAGADKKGVLNAARHFAEVALNYPAIVKYNIAENELIGSYRSPRSAQAEALGLR